VHRVRKPEPRTRHAAKAAPGDGREARTVRDDPGLTYGAGARVGGAFALRVPGD